MGKTWVMGTEASLLHRPMYPGAWSESPSSEGSESPQTRVFKAFFDIPFFFKALPNRNSLKKEDYFGSRLQGSQSMVFWPHSCGLNIMMARARGRSSSLAHAQQEAENPRESWFSRLFPPAFFNCGAHSLSEGAAWIHESSSLFFLSASTVSFMTLCDLPIPYVILTQTSS